MKFFMLIMYEVGGSQENIQFRNMNLGGQTTKVLLELRTQFERKQCI